MPIELTPELIDAIIYAESSGNPEAVSPAGATGLMQLMPIAWKDVQQVYPDMAKYSYEKWATNPDINKMFGKAYLSILNKRLKDKATLENLL